MVKIINKNLELFLSIRLGKNIKDIDSSELKNINQIVLEGNAENTEGYSFDEADINQFENLKKITLSRFYITPEIYEYLLSKNLDSIIFNQCVFSKLPKTQSTLKGLEINKCYIEDYSFLETFKELEKLVITNPYTENEIDIKNINSFQGLKYLILDNCIINNFEYLATCSNIEYLSILGTVVEEGYENIIYKLPNLKELFISEEYIGKLVPTNFEVKTDLREYAFEK